MKRRIRSYEAEDIIIDFDARRCIHAAECVRGLPAVFDPERRPWIDPEGEEDRDRIVQVIERCPSGALHYRLRDSAEAERPQEACTIRVEPNGPLYARGDLRVQLDEDEVVTETRLALCRCGLSSNKPFCDNSHLRENFEHDGRLGQSSLKDEEPTDSAVELRPLPDGPLLVAGPVTIEGPGDEQMSGTGGALCRCGHSANKPFCDGTHRKVGFKST